MCGKISCRVFAFFFVFGLSAHTFSEDKRQGATSDRSMGANQLQNGDQERLRSYDPDQVPRQNRKRERDRDCLGDKAAAMGLVSPEECQRYRDRLHSAQTKQEREEIRQQHRDEIRARARERGLEDNP